jgi:DNA-binding GntR family transcriptional regulator
MDMKLIDKVYGQMKADVFAAMYKPNVLIVERDIAEKYEISKVTAGEVLHRLCSEGHLTSYPRSGYMVTMVTPREMEQLKRMRIVVESLTLSIVCEEAGDDAIRTLYGFIRPDFGESDSATTLNSMFHMALAKLTQDKYVISLTESLLGSASRVEQYVQPDRITGWQEYHIQLVDALLKRDAANAKQILIDDINQR